MSRAPITVGHLVTPYLFPTGTWIHTQLVKARGCRPIVLTRRLDHPERFPFEPVYLVGADLGPVMRTVCALRTRVDRVLPQHYRPILEREGVQVLHAHLGWEGARATSLAQATGLPLVTTFYGLDAGRMPRLPWWRWRYKRLFAIGGLFLVEGPNLGRTLEAVGCPAQKIRVVHLGIDLDRIGFAPRHGPASGPIEVLISSSLRPKKGVPAAVRAFAQIARAHPRVHLRILGDGPERLAVEMAARTHGIQSRVHLEGYVSYDEHLAALGRAHLFLAASHTAPDGDTEGGAPVALIEAQASGLPIVATRHADIPEVVEDGVSGLLSPEYDEDALAANLDWLLKHPERWAAMGKAGRARMEREFNAGAQADILAGLYASLV